MIERFAMFLFFALAIPSAWADGSVAAGRVIDVPISEWSAASVSEVYAGEVADLVIVDAGYDRNFCTGARCRVERNGKPVAEIVIAESAGEQSVALIINLVNNQTIQTGDTVKLKTL